MKAERYRVRRVPGGEWVVVWSKYGILWAMLKFWWKTRKLKHVRSGEIL